MVLGKHDRSPESPRTQSGPRQSKRIPLLSAKALAIATDNGKQHNLVMASRKQETSMKDVLQTLQEMETRHLSQMQQLAQGYEQGFQKLIEENRLLIESNKVLVQECKNLTEKVAKMENNMAKVEGTLGNLEKAMSSLPATSQPRSYASAASSPNLLPPTIAVTPPNSSPNLSSISDRSPARAMA